MKDRRAFQIIDGSRHSSGKAAQPRAFIAQAIPRDTAQALPCLLREQGGNSLADALTASEQRLSALLYERSRLGRELHETVLQALHAIVLTLAQFPGLRQVAEQAVACSSDQATDQLQKLIQDIRRMILSVESDNVVPFRLVSELQSLAQNVERMSSVQVRLEIEQAAEEVLTGEESRELVTITREALNNCARYARATRIVIALRRIGSRVCLSIRDNGSGFAVGQGPAKGMGFAQMEERVRKIGGCLNIHSKVGQGTCITADIYLEPILTTI